LLFTEGARPGPMPGSLVALPPDIRPVQYLPEQGEERRRSHVT